MSEERDRSVQRSVDRNVNRSVDAFTKADAINYIHLYNNSLLMCFRLLFLTGACVRTLYHIDRRQQL